MKIEHDTVRLPARWAYHLVTGDVRGMTPEQIAEIASATNAFRDKGWSVIGFIAGSEREGKGDYVLYRARNWSDVKRGEP